MELVNNGAGTSLLVLLTPVPRKKADLECNNTDDNNDGSDLPLQDVLALSLIGS